MRFPSTDHAMMEISPSCPLANRTPKAMHITGACLKDRMSHGIAASLILKAALDDRHIAVHHGYCGPRASRGGDSHVRDVGDAQPRRTHRCYVMPAFWLALIRTYQPKLQVGRNIVHFGGQSTWLRSFAITVMKCLPSNSQSDMGRFARGYFLGERMTKGRFIAKRRS